MEAESKPQENNKKDHAFLALKAILLAMLTLQEATAITPSSLSGTKYRLT
jgi:hypothetical protein